MIDQGYWFRWLQDEVGCETRIKCSTVDSFFPAWKKTHVHRNEVNEVIDAGPPTE